MNPNDSRPIKGRSLRLAKSLPLCLFTVALLASRSPAAENSHSATASNAYIFTPISLCASCSTLPIGVAANGLISGLYFDAIGNLHAFVARNGNYLTVDVPGALFTEAGRSNEPGQTAGDYLAADGIDRPFVRNRDGSFSLRNGAPGASVTIGNDINNRGDVLETDARPTEDGRDRGPRARAGSGRRGRSDRRSTPRGLTGEARPMFSRSPPTPCAAICSGPAARSSAPPPRATPSPIRRRM